MNEIIYLAHPYTNHPLGEQGSFEEAIIWCDLLERGYGLDVYSPIIESHYKWIYIKEHFPKEDWPKHEYWLDKDLFKIDKLKAGDGGSQLCGYCGFELNDHYCVICKEHLFDHEIIHKKYDSDLVMFMSETAFNRRDKR